MTDDTPDFDVKTLEAMNEKAIQNQFFTPDNVYIELGLFKDFSIGAAFMEHLVLKPDEEKFDELQQSLITFVTEYQKRRYDTVEPYFKQIGYSDSDIDEILNDKSLHDQIFMVSPVTKFTELLIRHTMRNQNNSRPANKYVKQSIDAHHYKMEPIEVTYLINTYPLELSPPVQARMAIEFGEAFGVNITFMCKNPTDFEESDWDLWMEKIDCFYLDNLGRFTRSEFVLKKQGDMQFAGIYFFARKRFERCVIQDMLHEDFDQQIQIITAQLGMFCDFEWLQNNAVRLTDEAEDVPMTDPDNVQDTPDTTPDSGTST